MNKIAPPPPKEPTVADVHTPGDCAVWNDSAHYFSTEPRYETAEIMKVTAKTVTTKATYGKGENRRSSSDILWSGPEDEAKALVERLTSSVGLMKDEVRRSRERHAQRATDLFAKASSKGPADE